MMINGGFPMRNDYKLENNWFFSKGPKEQVPVSVDESWESVSLPHCWNRYDGQDGGADYYRGVCWYVKNLELPVLKPGTQTYIEILAAASACEAYVNGQKVTAHEGGYSIFRANITTFLKASGNVLSVMVTNQHQDQIYPQMADFTFYGGLYRGVNLITVPETHFDLDHYGSQGITVTSKITEEKQAKVTLHAYVTDPQEIDQVIFTIYDQEKNPIASAARPAQKDTTAKLLLMEPHLWQGVKDPYLYTVDAVLVRHNEVLDEVKVRHGFRSFSVDPQKGFYLNGILTPLRGVSRHQDRLDLGNALTYKEHLEDAQLIKELGANTIRLAHYQHSQDFYDICDEMGFIIWAEIPFISSMNPLPAAHQNCISQMTELIMQNYNHSCICFWGISNEITIGESNPQLVKNLKELNRLAHELDPSRLTTMAQVSALPMEDEQNQITSVVSYNHYFGWYQGVLEDNEKWLDAFHAMHPDRALGISEYGCEGIITYHNDTPKGGDYSEEYQAAYHEHMAQVIDERPWLWATHIWNMFDFGCDARDEGGVAGRNNKGLMTLDRKIKKDSFFLYQAYWSEAPVLHICSKRYAKRAQDKITVKVYSNQPEVSLYVDGVFTEKKSGNRVFVFENVELKDSFTTVTVKAGQYTDTACFEKVAEPYAPYVLIEDESNTGVTNWFDNVDMTQSRPLTFHEGYFSIKDPMNDILKNDEASTVLVNAISSLMGMNLKKSMLGIMGTQTLESLGSKMPSKEGLNVDAVMSYINTELQKIEK